MSVLFSLRLSGNRPQMYSWGVCVLRFRRTCSFSSLRVPPSRCLWEHTVLGSFLTPSHSSWISSKIRVALVLYSSDKPGTQLQLSQVVYMSSGRKKKSPSILLPSSCLTACIKHLGILCSSPAHVLGDQELHVISQMLTWGAELAFLPTMPAWRAPVFWTPVCTPFDYTITFTKALSIPLKKKMALFWKPASLHWSLLPASSSFLLMHFCETVKWQLRKTTVTLVSSKFRHAWVKKKKKLYKIAMRQIWSTSS